MCSSMRSKMLLLSLLVSRLLNHPFHLSSTFCDNTFDSICDFINFDCFFPQLMRSRFSFILFQPAFWHWRNLQPSAGWCTMHCPQCSLYYTGTASSWNMEPSLHFLGLSATSPLKRTGGAVLVYPWGFTSPTWSYGPKGGTLFYLMAWSWSFAFLRLSYWFFIRTSGSGTFGMPLLGLHQKRNILDSPASN